jgi:glycosyltransferase involved in cell wall biosynthesis
MKLSEQTVAVIIPMYNGAATIDETLASVCKQTHTNLDIVVVDDGSTDNGASRCQEWCAKDSRVRLVRQENAGVAAARNHGARATDAALLAFVDADDLWAPEKIEAQIQVLEQLGSADALVWSWFVHIDENGTPDQPRPWEEGDDEPLEMLSRVYALGNASSMLMSRRVFEESGGFDSSLRARGYQGCEDVSFVLRAAASFPLKVVKRHLVGYRVSDEAMSANTYKMWRSWELVVPEFFKSHPQYMAEVERQRSRMQEGWFYRSLQTRSYRNAFFFFKEMRRHKVGNTSGQIGTAARSMLRDFVTAATFGRARRKPAPKLGKHYLSLQW